jgi:hypothetical protein
MFRALLCSSSGGQILLIQHLISSHSVGDRPVHRLGEKKIRKHTLSKTIRPLCIKTDNIKVWRIIDIYSVHRDMQVPSALVGTLVSVGGSPSSRDQH